ncbi:MAG: hypothetical protein Q7R32_03840 [Dehalococcoidia bacterium]|nr:hypothetical protein [Dehalococcoidia bacterium]
MTLLSGRLNVLLAMALAALLALGVVSAFAGPAPDDPGDVVTVDTGDGDTEGDTEGGDSGEVVCGVDGDTGGDTGDTSGDTECDVEDDVEGDTDVDTEGDDTADTASHDGDGPNPDRGCATGSLDHAREVLTALLERDHPGENEGIQNALDKMCHGIFYVSTDSEASGDADDSGGDDADGGDSDAEGSGGDESTHPGNGHAFGRGHGHGKP